MTTKPDRRPEIDRLQGVLDVHGGDRDRWPAADRLELARLLANDGEAKTLLAEAKIFDRLLDMAPGPYVVRTRVLADRIIAAVRSEGQTIVDDVGRASRAPASREEKSSRHAPPAAWLSNTARSAGRSAVLLAASLLMGLFAGATLLSGDVPGGTRAAGEGGAELLMQQLVMGDESVDSMEEDLL